LAQDRISDEKAHVFEACPFVREYRLLEKLGEGGMGTVYKALHTRMNRLVALKMLPAERVAHAPSVARFAREIEAVGKLDHPNIVRAFDAGEDDEMHYLVMELVDGVDLHRLVKQVGPLTITNE
jgi:serine/threonine protein kinase